MRIPVVSPTDLTSTSGSTAVLGHAARSRIGRAGEVGAGRSRLADGSSPGAAAAVVFCSGGEAAATPRLLPLSSAQGARVAILAANLARQHQLIGPFHAAGYDNQADEDALAPAAPPSVGATPAEIHSFAAALASARYDVFVIDGALPAPHVDALLLALREGRPRDICVMVLVPGDHPQRQIARLLQAGADDYLSWPLAPVLLRAKLDVAVRRARHHAPARDCEVHGEYVFDLASHEVCMQRERVHLTPKEFSVALLLFRHQAQPLSRGFLQQQVWPHHSMLSTRTIDTHVSVVRAKLHLWPDKGYRVKTVYGFGYRLERVSEAERRALVHDAGLRGTVAG
ncbi:response regulator transcription factor [Pseudomonadota bacterium AL_CKDN230030165-1A_HGKHYDSX7]